MNEDMFSPTEEGVDCGDSDPLGLSPDLKHWISCFCVPCSSIWVFVFYGMLFILSVRCLLELFPEFVSKILIPLIQPAAVIHYIQMRTTDGN
jgi:hypothetical protein